MEISWICFKTFILSFPAPPWSECRWFVCGDLTYIYYRDFSQPSCGIDVRDTTDLTDFVNNYKGSMNP